MATSTAPIRLAPSEHGVWVWLGLPLALGLTVKPSWAGLCLAASAVVGFLLHQPLRRWWLRGRRPGEASVVALGVLVVLAGMVGTFVLGGSRGFLPLLIAAPAALWALRQEARLRARALGTEVAAMIALSSLAPALMLAGRGGTRGAMALWALLVLCQLPSLAYVRYRLAELRVVGSGERRRRRWAFHGLHLAALAGLLGLVGQGWASPLWLGWLLLLYVRAWAPLRRPASPAGIGIQESFVGLMGLALLCIQGR